MKISEMFITILIAAMFLTLSLDFFTSVTSSTTHYSNYSNFTGLATFHSQLNNTVAHVQNVTYNVSTATQNGSGRGFDIATFLGFFVQLTYVATLVLFQALTIPINLMLLFNNMVAGSLFAGYPEMQAGVVLVMMVVQGAVVIWLTFKLVSAALSKDL